MRELLKVLALGDAVEDPAKWKKRQILLTAISGGLTMLFNFLEFYGVKLPFEVSAEVINNISLSLLVVGNGVLTLATSKTVGLQPPAGESNP